MGFGPYPHLIASVRCGRRVFVASAFDHRDRVRLVWLRGRGEQVWAGIWVSAAVGGGAAAGLAAGSAPCFHQLFDALEQAMCFGGVFVTEGCDGIDGVVQGLHGQEGESAPFIGKEREGLFVGHLAGPVLLMWGRATLPPRSRTSMSSGTIMSSVGVRWASSVRDRSRRIRVVWVICVMDQAPA